MNKTKITMEKKRSLFFFFSSRRRHTRFDCDWSSDVCSSDLTCTGNPYGNTNCNGLFSDQAVARMQGGLREALRKLDNQVDWTQYDFDGDGYVDLVAFIHPPVDGACGVATNTHLWSHRFFLIGT